MDYKDFNSIDFIQDEYFVRWVKNPDEQSERFWKMWIGKHPEKRDEVLHAKGMLLDMVYKHDPVLSEDDYVEMFEGVLKRSRLEPKKNWKSKILRLPIIFRVAAIITLTISSIFALNHFHATEEIVHETSYIIKKAPRGQKATIWLDDRTKVHLNSESSIEYPKKFAVGSRQVYLEGEAYFEVTEDPNRPFVVRAGDIKTSVLGTSFNVRNYADEENIIVAVEHGKVKVENENDLTKPFVFTLTPNQMASFDVVNQTATRNEIDSDEYFEWKNGVIRFEKASINEIIKTLERWYGVTFIMNRQLNTDKDFSFRYQNKPLDEILEGLSFAFGFKFEIEEKIITIN